MKRTMIAVVTAGLFGCGGSGATAPATTTAGGGTATAPVAADGPATLQFKVFAQDGGGQRPVAPGAAMKTGDKVAMSVTVDRPVYVYVMQFFPDGTSAVLFPAGDEDNRVASEMRLPPAGWFQLDEVVGQENVYVVAATSPLSEADAAVKATVDEVRVSGSIPAPPPETTTETETATETETGTGTGTATGTATGTGTGTATGPVKKPKPKRPRPNASGGGTAQAHAVGGGGSPAAAKPVGRASLRTRGLTRVDDDGAGLTIKTDERGVAIFQFSFEHTAN